MRKLAFAVLAALLATQAAAQQAPAAPPPQPPPPVAAPPAMAPAPADDPTVHRHLGFFLRLDIGPGYLSSSASQGGIDAKIKGGAGQFSVNIGGAVAENVILSGHLWGFSAFSPDAEIGGISVPTGNDATLTLSGIGPSFTYYWMPTNLYLTVSPSITQLTAESNGSSGETEAGIGLLLVLGKEWWVSDHWGLGLNGQFAISSNKDKGEGAPTWGSAAFGVSFSATYN